MKRYFMFAIAAVCLGGFACSKDKDAKKSEEEAKVVAETPVEKPDKPKPEKPKEDPVLAALAKNIETEEDFEEQAEKEITIDNVETEAQKLSKELEAE